MRSPELRIVLLAFTLVALTGCRGNRDAETRTVEIAGIFSLHRPGGGGLIPCPEYRARLRRAPRRPDDPAGLHVWVDVRRSSWRGHPPASWPREGSDGHGDLYFFVRWRGTLTGPGRYGDYGGIHEYSFTVDSVIEHQPRTPVDALSQTTLECRKQRIPPGS